MFTMWKKAGAKLGSFSRAIAKPFQRSSDSPTVEEDTSITTFKTQVLSLQAKVNYYRNIYEDVIYSVNDEVESDKSDVPTEFVDEQDVIRKRSLYEGQDDHSGEASEMLRKIYGMFQGVDDGARSYREIFKRAGHAQALMTELDEVEAKFLSNLRRFCDNEFYEYAKVVRYAEAKQYFNKLQRGEVDVPTSEPMFSLVFECAMEGRNARVADMMLKSSNIVPQPMVHKNSFAALFNGKSFDRTAPVLSVLLADEQKRFDTAINEPFHRPADTEIYKDEDWWDEDKSNMFHSWDRMCGSALCRAVVDADPEAIAVLVADPRVNVNVKFCCARFDDDLLGNEPPVFERTDWSPLHFAVANTCYYDPLRNYQQLFEYEFRSDSWEYPETIVKILLSRPDLDTNAKNENGISPLWEALEERGRPGCCFKDLQSVQIQELLKDHRVKPGLNCSFASGPSDLLPGYDRENDTSVAHWLIQKKHVMLEGHGNLEIFEQLIDLELQYLRQQAEALSMIQFLSPIPEDVVQGYVRKGVGNFSVRGLFYPEDWRGGSIISDKLERLFFDALTPDGKQWQDKYSGDKYRYKELEYRTRWEQVYKKVRKFEKYLNNAGMLLYVTAHTYECLGSDQ